ncbi:MAG: phasin family protein [Alphaproteobacteria bacterium]|nr:phasin family protein [Alphaproteobacteria bacterium]
MKHHKPSQFHEDTPFAAPMTEVFGKGASMFGRSFATLQKEGLRFFNQRLEDNVKAAEEFGSCKSLPDLFAAQQKWFAGMTSAYAEEWQRCSELMSDTMRDTGEEAAHDRPRPDETR